MDIQEIIDAWNGGADRHNQWWSLSENERIEFAAKLDGEVTLFKTEEWSEDYGDCLFFHFHTFEEPPEVTVTSPFDDDFNDGFWHYFMRLDFNSIFNQAKRLR